MPFELIRHDALAVTPWHNGAGRKADIATGPGWMVGFAWLEREAPFSDFSGHDRTITLIDGPGFCLMFPDDRLDMDRAFLPRRFDGGRPTRCTVAGPCVVLNAMTERSRLSHQVSLDDLPAAANEVARVLVVLSGRVGPADPRDAFLLDGESPAVPPDARTATIAIRSAA